MLLWLQFTTKYCYRLQEGFGNSASPSSLLDLFKHCHKRHWIQCGEGGQLLPSCTNCTGRARCFHMGICARLMHPCSVFVPHQCNSQRPLRRLKTGSLKGAAWLHGPEQNLWPPRTGQTSWSLMCTSCDLAKQSVTHGTVGKVPAAPFPQEGK